MKTFEGHSWEGTLTAFFQLFRPALGQDEGNVGKRGEGKGRMVSHVKCCCMESGIQTPPSVASAPPAGVQGGGFPLFAASPPPLTPELSNSPDRLSSPLLGLRRPYARPCERRERKVAKWNPDQQRGSERGTH